MLKITFRLERTLKGTLQKEVILATGRGGGDCGYRFDVGQSYLVYAYGDDMSSLATNICQRTAILSAAGDDQGFSGNQRVRDRRTVCRTKPNKALGPERPIS